MLDQYLLYELGYNANPVVHYHHSFKHTIAVVATRCLIRGIHNLGSILVRPILSVDTEFEVKYLTESINCYVLLSKTMLTNTNLDHLRVRYVRVLMYSYFNWC